MESSCDSSTAKEGVKSGTRTKLVSVEECKEENVASGIKRKLQEALATDTDDAIAVVGDCDDFEFTMESLSAVEFAGYSVSLFWDESSLALRMRDNLSKRLFTAKYSHSQLVTDMKFPQMSCEAICALVSHSMEGSSESLACSSEQTGANKIALILKHTVIEGHSIEYRIQLTEVSQKETDVLLAIIADLRNDISASQQRGDEMQSIVCHMEKKHKKEIKTRAAMKASMDAEIKDFKAQMKAEMAAMKRKIGPRIASYRSNSMVGRFRKWDTVELAPTKDGMIQLSSDRSEFRIKVAGLYRVLSAVSIQYGCMSSYTVSLLVNGTSVCQARGGHSICSPLCFVGRLMVGDKIKVSIDSGEFNNSTYNWIQIEKL